MSNPYKTPRFPRDNVATQQTGKVPDKVLVKKKSNQYHTGKDVSAPQNNARQAVNSARSQASAPPLNPMEQAERI
eukprot:CAMPEP_0178935092 /NCGR_PEP_ID=MMETSP0786-20121207/24302_1 /TAXON_ID=186022 /ORGANISM="Thalassionema frauenfeldii, Strain CCMP 1798" /LENGTH=74 /DNA_ID=CAMNT_0020613099 /DNA_START=159 /DNA_END=383 /DNA_ORIENTATION=+